MGYVAQTPRQHWNEYDTRTTNF